MSERPPFDEDSSDASRLDDLRDVAAALGGTVSQFDSRRSDERVVVLEDVVSDDSTKNISISMDSNGTFRWRGHDTGRAVTEFWGSDISDYEWVFAVPASRVPKLVAVLRGRADEEVLELVRKRFEDGVDIPELLRGPTVSAEFSNWQS